MLRKLVDTARDLRPHVFVAIDFPDFNFKLMAALRRLGIPIVYYVSPQLWAWRPGRMDTMKEYVDRVLVIFPFEEALCRRADGGAAPWQPAERVGSHSPDPDAGALDDPRAHSRRAVRGGVCAQHSRCDVRPARPRPCGWTARP